MSKVLTWDNTGERLYETGTKKVALYLLDAAGVYNNGVAWNGITAITESPSGADATKIYADDTKYLTLRSAEEFGGTIEAYTYPDEWAKCDGSVIDSGISFGQQSRQTFGLSYRTALGNDIDGSDHGYKLHLVYGATASPSSRSYQTINDSPEAITFSWEFDTVPVNVETKIDGKDLKPVSCITIDSTKFTDTNAAKLKALEDALYGTSTTDPYLPSPDQVYKLLTTGSLT